ncbi:MAG TPA: DUF5667 domain-containing protein [Mycobacteriales bacterium]|jgi:hypothetical protein
MRRTAKLAEEFAAALEGRGVASARRDPALAPLLSLAEGLQTVPVAASADFRDTLRRRLMAVATVPPVAVPAPSPVDRAKTWVEGWRVQRAMAAAAASMAAVVGISAVGVGASRSLPGDALYGIKRSAEGAQLALARNDVNRGKRHLQHAETRLGEIAQLVDTDLALAAPAEAGQITVAFGGSRSERVGEALRLMDEDTRDGTRLLFEAYANEQDDDVLHAVRDFTQRQRGRLGQVLDKLPTSAHAKAEESLALVASLDLRASQLLSVGTCGSDCPAPAPVAPSPGETTAPTPKPSPSYDSLGPLPCTCPEDPTGSPEPAPSPEPTQAPSPEPTQSPTPSPQPTQPSPTPSPTQSHYPLPSQIPPPVASPLQTVVDEVNEQLPTPLPTLPPLPGVDAPLVPGVTLP